MRIVSLLAAAAAIALGGSAAGAATLVGYAQLPAATFVPGPTSGQFGIGGSGYAGPFVGQQPVQGFSSIIANGRGGYTALSDNGFGTKANSADALLLVHDLTVDFRTATFETIEVALPLRIDTVRGDEVLLVQILDIGGVAAGELR